MKSRLLLASLCAISSTASVLGMDVVTAPKKAPRKRESYLMFEVGKTLRIREYGSRNMEFLVPPRDFVGKKITEAVPLSVAHKQAFELAFEKTRKENVRAKVRYAVADAQFSAAIRYLADKQRYSVKVTEVKKPQMGEEQEAAIYYVAPTKTVVL